MIHAGMILKDYNAEVGKVMESELKAIGLLTDADIKNQDPSWPAYKSISCMAQVTFWALMCTT